MVCQLVLVSKSIGPNVFKGSLVTGIGDASHDESRDQQDIDMTFTFLRKFVSIVTNLQVN